MKICPGCGAEFDGGETFCPNDGTRLDEVSEAAGDLVGEVLAGIVRLERIEYADSMGERFTGRLADSKRPVYVTVFNRSFRPGGDAPRLVETARAKVGSPLPESLSTLLRVELGKRPPFVVESSPRGPSIRALIEERGRLDWQSACKIAANVARLVEWMTSHDVYHHGLHPGSIFITDLQKGHVQLGEWYSETAQWVENPLQVLNSDPSHFVGYVAYMAPELAESSSVADLRSSVYALGVLLYEMIVGKPPFVSPNGAEVLRRHLHEKPIRASIARSGGEIHPDLDQILDMMLAKNPDKRFQAPFAIVAALSNLVGEDPDVVAPPVERAEEMEDDELYQTIEMSQIDRSAVPGLAPTRPDRAPASSPRDTAQNPVAKATAPDRAPVVSGAEDDEYEEPVSQHKTLMMGNIGKAMEEETRRQAEAAEAENVDAAPRATMIMGSAVDLGTAPPADEVSDSGILKPRKIGKKSGEQPSVAPTRPDGPSVQLSDEFMEDVRRETGEHAAVNPDDLPEDERPTRETAPLTVEDAVPTHSTDALAPEEQESTGDGKEVPAEETEEKADAEVPEAETDAEASAAEGVEPEVADVGASVAGEPSGEEPEAEEARAETVETSEKPKVELKDIGFVDSELKSDADKDDWFARSAEDAWDDSLTSEHQAVAESGNKKVIVGLIVFLIVGFVGVIVYVQFLYNPVDPVVTNEVSPEPAVEQEDPAAKVTEALERFEEAMEKGWLIAPVGKSAASQLETMKRAAPEDARFIEASKRFVEIASKKAREVDAAGDLMLARNLAGYASQFATEDAELKKYAEHLHARYTGAVSEVDADAGTEIETDAGTPQADSGSEGGAEMVEEPAVEEPAVEEKAPEVKPAEKPVTAPKPVVVEKPKPKPAPVVTLNPKEAAALARQARSAYSRGDFGQAQMLYEAAMELDPKSHTVYSGLGQVFFDKGSYSQAAKHQKKAVSLAPGRVDYRLALGQSYYRLAKYQDAIATWEKVLEKDPNNKTAKQYIQLAKRYVK